MEEQTFRSRLVELLGKSRKAMRLYSGVSRSKRGTALAEIQATEWLNVNSELVTSLSTILDEPNQRNLSTDATMLLDQFLIRYQITVEDMHAKKRKLISYSENSDFSQAAILSRELVGIKARAQALQAVYNELKAVVKKIRSASEAISLTNEDLFPSEEEKRTPAKVIPLRQKISLG